MMWSEFCEISKCQVSYKAYSEIFEPMYMAVNMDKHDFVKLMLPTIKAVYKQEREERKGNEQSKQKLVFVSNGDMTPNGCLYIGGYYKLDGCDIATGKPVVRELTLDEFETEVYGKRDEYMSSSFDYYTDAVLIARG